jgi:hypothetical protein
MKKLTALVMGSVLLSFSALAQSDASKAVPGRSSFYAELGGPGVLFSANIDTRFKPSRLGLGGRAGIGFVTTSDYDTDPGSYRNRSVLTVPVQLNYIFGKGTSPHTFEVGAGLTFLGKSLDVFDIGDRDQFLGTFAFMYRRQPVDGGFGWRIGFTPIVGGGYIQPSGGVGVGYNF